MGDPALVVIVDDDESVREALPDLLGELGYRALTFVSAEELLASGAYAQAQGMLLDIGLPGLSGPDLRRQLIGRGYRIPTIFITAQSEQSVPPDVLGPGETCLYKPFSDGALRVALEAALKGK